MKKILLLLSLTASLAGTAQNNRQPVLYKKAVSLSPLALADIDHTLMVTGEYRLKDNLALLADLGYVFVSDYLSQERKTWGLNIRPSVRLYYGRRNKGYLQAQAFYKSVTYTLNDWVGKDCVNDVPAYQELRDFNYRKNVVGFHMIAGALLPLSPSHKWLIDLYGGLGFRYKEHHLPGNDDFCYNINNGRLFNFQLDGVTTLSVPMGVRITYVLQ